MSSDSKINAQDFVPNIAPAQTTTDNNEAYEEVLEVEQGEEEEEELSRGRLNPLHQRV